MLSPPRATIQTMSKSSNLVAVIGAKGGVGASCVAAAVARSAQTLSGRGVLVDLDTAGGGVEVLLGIESEPGARWPEMMAAFGEVDGSGLLAALPRWGPVPVLSAARQSPLLPPDEVVLDVCAGLLRNGEAVVLDVPRPAAWTPAIKALLADASVIYLVVPAVLTAVAGAFAVASAVSALSTRRRGPVCELVVRSVAGGATHSGDISDLIGWPIAAVIKDDRQMAAAIEIGAGPLGGPLARRSNLTKATTQLARQAL